MEDFRRFTLDDLVRKEQECGVFGPFCTQKYLKRAPAHVREELARAKRFPWLRGSSQGFLSMDNAPYNPSNFTSVTASATETNLWTPAIWTPIPANDMRGGKGYQVKFGGIFTSTATQGVLTWTPRVGQSSTPASNVSLGASNATAPPASLTNAAFYGEVEMTIRALGLAAAGASAVGHGQVFVQGAAAATGIVYVMGGTVIATADNTAASGLIVSLTISVASQSYTCQWVRLASVN